jgi:diadenosine tetraphosphate (Ap4A) HIT family hydrolase
VGDCALCGPLPTPKLREGRHWVITLNRNQNLLGKLMVVLARHEESVASLAEPEWLELRDHIGWAAQRLERAFAPDHVNYAFLQNQDRHVHLHIIPRYASSRSVDGLQFNDPDFPRHYAVPGRQRIANTALIAAIAGALMSNDASPTVTI